VKVVNTPPPSNEEILQSNTGTKTTAGLNIESTLKPIETTGNSSIEVPVQKENKTDLPFTVVEIEAKFSGNWASYLRNEIEKNMDELTEAGESGTCIIRFVVSKDGSVSNVEATTMKGTKLAEVAVNAIRRGPKWIPAQQNGMIVNAYRMQPVTFKIQE
jgi:protein TonB